METLEMPVKQSELVLAGEKINNGLIAFQERKAILTELAAEATGLTINGVDDKVGFLKVSTVRKKLKAARVEIEKEGKSLRDTLTVISKNISSKEKELVAIISPSEDELLAEEKRIEDEKEVIRLEAVAKENARVQARIDKLAAFGFSIDYTTIMAIDDATFETVLTNAESEFKKEQEVKAELERLAELEKQKIEDERKELELLRQKAAAAQKIIDDEKERVRIADEAAKQKILDDEAAAQQKIIDEQRAAQLEKERIENEAKAEQKKAADLEKARLQGIEDARIEAEKKAEQVIADKKEADRQACLRPDKEKLEAFAQLIGSLIDFQVTDEKAQLIVNDVTVMIGKMQSHIIKKIKEL